MARLVEQGGCITTQLSASWACLTTPPRAAKSPLPCRPAGTWLPTVVPGTVATALQAASTQPAGDLHAFDHWYRLETPFPASACIEFGGLATLAEIWLDGILAATSDTMFLPLTVPIPPGGASRLEICFRALRPALRRRQPGPRPRWKGRLTSSEALRGFRTTLLGHMPGWSGDTPVIGPFRPIVLHVPVPGIPLVTHADIRSELLPDGTGIVTLRLEGHGLTGRQGSMNVADWTVGFRPCKGGLLAELTIPHPPRWWPHTHGIPVTLPVTARVGSSAIDLGRIGFRRIERRDPAAGFGLKVNDVPVFCRGAIWTGLDGTALPADPADLRSILCRAQQAGMNMLRVTGMTIYETPTFFDLCDELGIMVWHDFMFARFDYPDHAEFFDGACKEARAFLDGVQAHPSLTVLCGGSELVQAAIMSGCPPDTWRMPLFELGLAQEAAAARPDVLYLPHSPWSAGEQDILPVAPSASVAHYFGVGGYQRPLQDLDDAGVRFAAECLAFANLPEPETYRQITKAAGPAVSKFPVPRDLGAEWDFADVRDHYTQSLFGVSAQSLRRQDPEALLDYGRATVALIMQQVMSTWRSDDRCGGALVLMLQDLLPSAGWGVIDSDGRPKSTWYALRSVNQPVQLILRDLGQNGLALHAINETPMARPVRLTLQGLSPDGVVEQLGIVTFVLQALESRAVMATTLLGRWRDLTNAWQFGTPPFTVLGATLCDAETGRRLSEATHFPMGPALPRSQPHLTAELSTSLEMPTVVIATRGFAQFVQIDDASCIPADNYFHLWPGETRVIPLQYPSRRKGFPSGTVRALNSHAAVHYGVAA